MNNFDGQMNLYPEICIDNFDSKVLFNPCIRCFILTHFHDDHMKNLEDFTFLKVLENGAGRVKFLCSPITRSFIETCDKYAHLGPFCTEVPCETPTIVRISSSESVTITFCGSGHCPGSVMAFVEGTKGNVLFTGDFRLPMHCAQRLAFFKGKGGVKEMKDVQTLYVDMTFFKPEVRFIPTREDSVKALLKFIRSFLQMDTHKNSAVKKNGYFANCIYLKTSARIGYEYVFQEIFQATGFKIHVSELIYRIYDQLPMIQCWLTLDPYETPIHSCMYESKKRDQNKGELMSLSKKTLSQSQSQSQPSQSGSQSSQSQHMSQRSSQLPSLPCTCNGEYKRSLSVHCAKVMMSAMWFTDTAGVDKIFLEYMPHPNERDLPAYKPYRSIYRLCYSFHSSFEEIVNFVDSIKPKRLYSIALPEATSEQTISEYFFDANGVFQGFHHTQDTKIATSSQVAGRGITRSLSDLKPLVIRKRKSFELSSSYHAYGGDNSNADTSSETESSSHESLNFGSDSDNDKITASQSSCKKLKS